MGRSLALLPFALLIAANPDVAGAGPGEAWALATRAEVAAPDGIAFTTVLVSLPDGTALLEQFHPEGDTRLLVDGGGRVFAGDGEGTWQPAEPEMAEVDPSNAIAPSGSQ